jgi:hypothetical protein
VAAEGQGEVRADRRDVAVPDEGREDGRRPRLDRLRRRPPRTICCSSSSSTRSCARSSRAASA